MLWVVLIVAYVIWTCFGTPGLEGTGTVGAMIVMGFGVHNFLNTFWKTRAQKKKEPTGNSWDHDHRVSRARSGFLPWARGRTTLPSHSWEKRLMDQASSRRKKADLTESRGTVSTKS